MVATPPGWRRTDNATETAGIAAYSLAVLAGSLVLAGVLHKAALALGAPAPIVIVLLVPVASLVAGPFVKVDQLPQSHWRVPRFGDRIGHLAYAGVFGGALGLGVFTALPAVSLYTVLAWFVAAPSWNEVWPVAVAFAFGRALPLWHVTVLARRQQHHPAGVIDGLAVAFSRSLCSSLFCSSRSPSLAPRSSLELVERGRR